MHTLPVLTTDGRGALEVGAGFAGGAGFEAANGLPAAGLVPVFSLPSVHRDASFVNRIPRTANPDEALAREREKEEMRLMQETLGLSEADLGDLEASLGMRERRQGVNEVDRYIRMQLAGGGEDGGEGGREGGGGQAGGGTVPGLNLSGARKRGQRRAEEEAAALLNRSTPRCLGLGAEASPAALRDELGRSIHSMQALTSAVKEDVIAIQKMCKIDPSHGSAGRYMKSWAVEKVAGILQDLCFSYVATGWRRWSGAVRAMRKEEKMEKYVRAKREGSGRSEQERSERRARDQGERGTRASFARRAKRACEADRKDHRDRSRLAQRACEADRKYPLRQKLARSACAESVRGQPKIPICDRSRLAQRAQRRSVLPRRKRAASLGETHQRPKQGAQPTNPNCSFLPPFRSLAGTSSTRACAR
jgi:hypothetical protein